MPIRDDDEMGEARDASEIGEVRGVGEVDQVDEVDEVREAGEPGQVAEVTGGEESPSAHELSVQLREVLTLAALARPALARRLGLSVTEVWAVEHLLAAPIGPVELGRRLDITSASSTVLVRRLEAAGHVRRERHPSDRRRTVLRVTESAVASVREAVDPLVQDVDAAGEPLGADEREVVAGYLRRVGRALERMVATPADEDATREESPRP